MASLALNEKQNWLNFMIEPFHSLSLFHKRQKGNNKLLKQSQITSGAGTWVNVKIEQFSESKVEM